MSKIIKYGFEAKQAIKAGVDKAANAIKVTLGPTGKAVILDKSYGSPTITDDGVTVAKDIELEDKFENVGASLIQEVANKTNEQAGDGTTTATVLAQKMIEEAFEAAALASTQANEIKKGMDKPVPPPPCKTKALVPVALSCGFVPPRIKFPEFKTGIWFPLAD